MAFKIAVVSGKGGTGKTTVSVSLSNYFQRLWGAAVHLVDCDVEEPNAALFFSEKEKRSVAPVYQEIPEIDLERCTFCRECSTYCSYNAIVVLPSVKFAQVDPNLCHSCGACLHACKEDALHLYQKQVGELRHYKVGATLKISEAELTIGSAMQTFLIRELKKTIGGDSDWIIYDAPPGTSCSVVATLSDVDLVLVVAEPTPFGVHDMCLTLDLLKELNLPHGVVVNKAGMGNDQIYEVLERYQTPVFGRIPFDRDFAHAYAQGLLSSLDDDPMLKWFRRIMFEIERRMPAYERVDHSER